MSKQQSGKSEVLLGDCVELMREMPEASVDAIVTDPPYGLEFMGKEWDGADGFRRSLNAADVGRDDVFGRASRTSPEYRAGRLFQEWSDLWAREALRVLKPGGHLLAFGGTRTYHRLACAVEDAGFEVRDTVCWLYGSGFPKGTNKAKLPPEWQGWNTALKPAHEPVVVARKSLVGTVAANLAEHGTGALNVDGCRLGTDAQHKAKCESVVGLGSNRNGAAYGEWTGERESSWTPAGRWPANVVLDEEAAGMLDEQTAGTRAAKPSATGTGFAATGHFPIENHDPASYADHGGASRFFYCAKASRSERGADNRHPTVKPLKLMCWLVRLVTPPGGIVLDPFAGSGTTGIAAQREGFGFIGLEREPEYVDLARERIRRDNPLANGLAA